MFTEINSIFDDNFKLTEETYVKLCKEIDENIEKSWKKPFCRRPTKASFCKSMFSNDFTLYSSEKEALDFYTTTSLVLI